jgi:hypothetical protein
VFAWSREYGVYYTLVLEGRKILIPTYLERKGLIGYDWYCLDKERWNNVGIIKLSEDENGSREVRVQGQVDPRIVERIEKVWMDKRYDLFETLKVIKMEFGLKEEMARIG